MTSLLIFTLKLTHFTPLQGDFCVASFCCCLLFCFGQVLSHWPGALQAGPAGWVVLARPGDHKPPPPQPWE